MQLLPIFLNPPGHFPVVMWANTNVSFVKNVTDFNSDLSLYIESGAVNTFSLTESPDILKDVENKLATGILEPNIVQKVSMSNIIEHLHGITPQSKGKSVLNL